MRQREDAVTVNSGRLRFTNSDIVFVVITLCAVLILRFFVFEVFTITGASMEPTLHNGQAIFAEKVSYRLNEPTRGDIMIFKAPNGEELIKRVIGLPGETIGFSGGTVYIDGYRLPDEFQFEDQTYSTDFEHVVEDGCYYMLGDNRDNSMDSRYFGEIGYDKFMGKFLFVLF